MELNKQAIEKVLSNKRLLNLILSKEPLSEKMWGLDELTTAQVLHVQEVYKRNPKLVELYLPKDDKDINELLKNISLIEEIFDEKIIIDSDILVDVTEVSFLEFIEKLNFFISTINNGLISETALKIIKQNSKEVLFESKLQISKKDNCKYNVSIDHTSNFCDPKSPNEAVHQFIHLFQLFFLKVSEGVIKDYSISLLGQEKYTEISDLIGSIQKSIFYSGDTAFSENGLSLVKSQLNQTNDLIYKKIVENKLNNFDEGLKSLKLLQDPGISLLDKLLSNSFAQHSNFWIVPGTPEKRCIIIFQGDFYDRDFFEIADLYSENGLSGSFLIRTSPSDPLARYLIKNKKISAYIQDTGLHHSSYAYENLRKSNLSDNEVSYVLSLPHNNEGDDAKSICYSKSFIEEMKPIEDIMF